MQVSPISRFCKERRRRQNYPVPGATRGLCRILLKHPSCVSLTITAHPLLDRLPWWCRPQQGRYPATAVNSQYEREANDSHGSCRVPSPRSTILLQQSAAAVAEGDGGRDMRRIIAVTVGAVVLVVAGLTSPHADKSFASAGAGMDQEQMQQLGDIISGIAERYPASFAGVEDRNDSFVIHTVAPDSEMRQALLSAPTLQGVPMEFAPASRTYADMENLSDQIAGASDELASEGIQLVQWGPNVVTNTVDVHLAQYSPEAAQRIVDQFGEGVTVAQESQEQPDEQADRYNDSSPFWGGDALEKVANPLQPWKAYCTTGANVVGPNGGQFMITAGHCFANGDPVYMAGRRIGTVSQKAYAQGGKVDAELINVSSVGSYIWTNNASQGDGASFTYVSHYKTTIDQSGEYVCFDGANTREVCGVKVDKTGQCVTFTSGHTTCGLTSTQPLSVAPSRGGDSGGPVYHYVNGQLVIHGMIVGGTSTVSYFEPETHVLGHYSGFSLQ